MGKLKAAISIFIIAIMCSLISAADYSIEFDQVGDKAIVKETVNGIKQASYVDSGIIEKSGSSYYFIKRLVFPRSFDNAEITINLDTGVIVSDMGAFPASYKTQSDGQIISLVWNLENVKENQTMAIFANLENTKYSYVWIYWALGIAAVTAIIFFDYKKFGRKEKARVIRAKTRAKKPEKEKYDEKLEYLLDTEKKVIELLKKADRNELWQKQIQDSTGFSKAKVSRLVRNLESRGLVAKIPFGNTNKVRLK